MEHEQNGYLNNDFRTCLANLKEHGMEAKPRGTTTKELLNYNITLINPRNRVISFAERNTNLKYLLGEFIWYIKGESTIDGIVPYSKFWANLTNSGDYDGYQKGSINSNYGNRLFGKSILPSFFEGNIQPINQWEETVELLGRDKDTRQAIMNIHVPSDRHFGNKDVPCTLTLHWFIREDKLSLIVNMRSNDVILGFTNDVFQFTMLQEAMLLSLKGTYPNLELGTYFHNANSMHIYDRHFTMMESIVENPSAWELEMIPMDVFDEPTILNLDFIQKQWLEAGMDEDFDFTKYEAFQSLSPYWQTLVQAFFNKDTHALHHIFGQQHDHDD